MLGAGGNIMVNVYGYVRVSSIDQNDDRQMLEMARLNIADKNIYADKQVGQELWAVTV